jgi:hypothetical protein
MGVFLRRYYEPSVAPIIGIAVCAVVGCAVYALRLATHPEVTYTRGTSDPHSWSTMTTTTPRNGEPRKLMVVQKKKLEELQGWKAI